MSPHKTISIFFTIVYFSFAEPQFNGSSLFRKTMKRLDPDYTYPQSYRDMTYTELSDNAKELFFAINIRT